MDIIHPKYTYIYILLSCGAGILNNIICIYEHVFKKEDKKYVRLNISKRYITLAPISNLVGISFKLSDPEKLLKDGKEGITLAFLEPSIMDFEIGSRHNPMDIPFPNGTIRAKNLIIPIESIIGGEKNASNGWSMLMDAWLSEDQFHYQHVL